MLKQVIRIFILALAAGCATPSRSMVSPDADLTRYTNVVIYKSDRASFIELQMAELFRGLGYGVVGSREDNAIPEALGVRYTTSERGRKYVITVLLEDTSTSKTLVTAEGTGHDALWDRPDEEAAWRAVESELRRILHTSAVNSVQTSQQPTNLW